MGELPRGRGGRRLPAAPCCVVAQRQRLSPSVLGLGRLASTRSLPAMGASSQVCQRGLGLKIPLQKGSGRPSKLKDPHFGEVLGTRGATSVGNHGRRPLDLAA